MPRLRGHVTLYEVSTSSPTHVLQPVRHLLVGVLFLLGAPLSGQLSSRKSFVIERYHQHLRFEADGTGQVVLGARVRVESEAAVQAFGQLNFDYDSATQRLVVDSVRVLKAGGQVVLSPASAVQDMSGPIERLAPMYTDHRQKIVTVPALRPGDTLEYHVTWTIHTPLAPGHFWRSVDFVRDAIVLDERLTLDVPRAKHVQVKTADGAQASVSVNRDRRVYEWRRANREVDTAAVPGRRRSGPPTVQITTFRSWEDLGQWYASLEREREAVTPQIQRVADSLVGGKSTRRDSISALYAFVATEFRYVSLSFGVGRYQPHSAAEVLANQYGDCKDKHVLLAALLGAVGVSAAPALISSTADIDTAVPSPYQFDHLITFVETPTEPLWLDATPAVAPFGFLLFTLRDKMALVMPRSGPARLVRTHEEPPFAPFDSFHVAGEIRHWGGLTATVALTLRGDAEVLIRDLFRQLPGARWEAFVGDVVRNQQMEGAVSAVRAGDPKDTREPFRFSFGLDRTDLTTWIDRRAEFRLPLPRLDLPSANDDSSTGDTLTLGPPARHVTHASLTLPAGMSARLPVAVHVSRDYAEYRSEYRMQGRTVLATRMLRIKARDLTGGRTPDLEAFRRAVQDDEKQTLSLTLSPDAPAASASGSVDDLHTRALATLAGGDARTARRMLRQVVEQVPAHGFAWNNLGRAFLRLNMLDSAEAAFRKQIAINPHDQYAHNNLGLALWRSRKRSDAAAAFRRQVEVAPLDRYAHANLARLSVELQRDSDAVASFERAVTITPDDASLLLDLGKAYLRVGRPDDGLAALERAVDLSPSARNWNNAAYALALAGVGLERAETYARAAVDATAASLRDTRLVEEDVQALIAVSALGAYWDTLGWVYFRQGEIAKAERYVRAAWLLSSSGEIGDHLGQIYDRLGRTDAALRAYAMALAAGRPPTETRGRLVARAGGTARADRLMQAARADLTAQRTVRLGPVFSREIQGRVKILLSPSGVEEVLLDGQEAPQRLMSAIRAAKFPLVFPDTIPMKLPRSGIITCSSSSGCALALIELGRMALPNVMVDTVAVVVPP